MGTREYTTVAARNDFSEVINTAAYGKERVALTRRGKIIAYVVPTEDVEMLDAIEDEAIAAELEERLADGLGETRPLDEVIAEIQKDRNSGGERATA